MMKKGTNIAYLSQKWIGIPTADVQEVVYCKDCKNYYESTTYGAICEEFGGQIKENDFCSRCPKMDKE